MFKSQKSIVNLLPILLLIIFTSRFGHGNQTSVPPATVLAGGSVQTSAPIVTPPTGSEDEANGDDGSLIKKDLEKEAKDIEDKKTQVDEHQFYKPEYISDPQKAMSYWVDFSKVVPPNQNISTKHEMLSKSHRRAAPIKLSFEFPFYGQPLKNIIIATGGFLYVGEHLHHWLAATQNISPLMANFDLSVSNSSDIHHWDNGTALTVQWQNVQMKENKPPGNFSFQVTLHKNGDIVFVYEKLPVPISEIPEEEHPVKVGISDAFLIDKVAFFIRRKTIYDYHRLNLKNVSEIKSQSAIYLHALPTCNRYETCDSCSKAPSGLDCMWCPAVRRCSNGFDRKRQEWLSHHCEKITKFDCSAKANDQNVQQAQASSSTATSSSNKLISVDTPNAGRQMIAPENRVAPESSRSSEGGTAFVTLLMFMALTSGIALWAFYAYKNPQTPSGQLLIKYRPHNWSWQNSETRYTAASIHM